MDTYTASVIIAAGGAGLRMGGPLPKQFTELLGIPILVRTIRAFRSLAAIGPIIVVLPAEHYDRTTDLLARFNLAADCTLVTGGVLRQDSVRSGLARVPADSPLVLVHDAARPLIDPCLIEQCLLAAERYGAAIPAIPVKDTIKELDEGRRIERTVDRTRLWRAQTPQAARTSLLQRAFELADRAGFIGTDEASLLEFAEIPVTIVEGSEDNLKITRPDDLRIAEALLGSETRRQPAIGLKVGHGFDAHRLVAGRPLVLGGLSIPHPLGLLGHSDADVLTHALCDAILGALGLGDIGRHFPDKDPRYKGILSIRLLDEVIEIAEREGFGLVNADITVIAERPKLAPHFPAMRQTIAHACRVRPEAINLKASTTEGLGYEGREEGVSAHAVVLLAGLAADVFAKRQ